MARGSSSKDLQGNTHDRRRRVAWMVKTFGSPSGKTIKCFHCARRMLVKPPSGRRRWEIDRFPICGHENGRYVRGNIVPSCRLCNLTRCTKAKKCRRGPIDYMHRPPNTIRRAAKLLEAVS